MTCRRPNCSRKERRNKLCYIHLEMEQRQRAERGEFVSGNVPAEKVQAHLERLFNAGWTVRRLAQATGVSDAGLRLIRSRTVVRGTTAARILAVPVEAVGTLDIGIGWVPAVGSMRRVQALNAIGYPLVELAERIGVCWQFLSCLTLGEHPRVRATTARRIAEVFNELQLTPAPRSRGTTYARTRAAKRGWLPPLAWDEDSIDNPDAEPQMPEDRKDSWFEDYRELRALGLNNDQIAERWDMRRESLYQRMRRMLPRDEYERWIA